MFELTIKDQVYEFHFGMGFMREINKLAAISIQEIPGQKQNVGLHYKLAQVTEGDVEALSEILEKANKGRKPRVTRDLIDYYIDDEDTDVDQLFEDVLSFLEKANATKKTMEVLRKAEQEAKKQQEEEEAKRAAQED